VFEICAFLLGHQHFVFAHRRAALPKEEAVRKGEIEKCASANHYAVNIEGLEKGCQEYLGLWS
jgi:hypothetical protein